MTNTAFLADDLASLNAQIKALTDKRDAVKAEILATGQTKIVGTLAEVSVTETFPTTFSKELASTLLSETDYKRCFATAIKATYTLRVKALPTAFA